MKKINKNITYIFVFSMFDLTLNGEGESVGELYVDDDIFIFVVISLEREIGGVTISQ